MQQCKPVNEETEWGLDRGAEFLYEEPGQWNDNGSEGDGELMSGENCSSDLLTGDVSEEGDTGDTKALDDSVDGKSEEIDGARAGDGKNGDGRTYN